MGHVYRFHQGVNTIKDWDISTAYGSTAINAITDPNGATNKKEITSIPSPFARMDLVKTAFKQVVDSKNLLGSTIHHKMVSDCFDIGEIFFNIDKYRDKIEIIIWDRKNDLTELSLSEYDSHKALSKTLELYLQQDATAYNFQKLDRIYLLNYKGPDKPAALNIIGATSPATLFFSSANNLDYVAKNIQFGNDRPFDNAYQPLFKRNFEYQKFWYYIKNSFPQFTTMFTELNNYLDYSYGYLSDKQKSEIDVLDISSSALFEPLTVENAANFVEVLGFNLLKKKENVTDIEKQSDFVIKPTNFQGAQKPLVLPVDVFRLPFHYIQDKWNKETKVPFCEVTALSERVLPGDGIRYPYLTISDFLEDAIVKMPYPLNSNRYFDGNFNKSEEGCSYLLPIKRQYFDYFTNQDLQKTMPDGKPAFELQHLSESIKAILRIPIKKGYITYERIYFENNEPDIEINRGAVTEMKFGLGLFSGVKSSHSNYRVSLFDKTSNNLDLSFYKLDNSNKEVEAKKVIRKVVDEVAGVAVYLIEENFDLIQLKSTLTNAIIIPKFFVGSKSAKYIFSVDFGTTNTHIEYSVDGSPSKPFDITNDDVQMWRLHLKYPTVDLDIERSYVSEFIPNTIGTLEEYNFPIRSAFAEDKSIDYNLPVYSLAHGNIPFRYEKAQIPNFSKIITGLKWDVNDPGRIELYLDNLFILMRSKVLLNNGSLEDTKIVWFYPASMTENRCNKIKKIWCERYRKNFGGDETNVITMSESVAPYNYYRGGQGAKSNVATIDIGGGTTDVFVVESKEPKLLSSFRFAANAIFGDGYTLESSNNEIVFTDSYSWTSDNNGFVQKFTKDIIEKLEANNLSDLHEAYKEIEKTKRSTDIITFFFSLAKNKKVELDKLNFNKILGNDENFKYVFIVFYSAIIYYVAKLLKAKSLEMPQTLAFSGNGSKVLQILSDDNKSLAYFAQLIFEKVFEKKYGVNQLDLKFNSENPKEATCKGGIINPIPQDYDKIEDVKCSLLGVDDSTLIDSKLTYDKISKTEVESLAEQTNSFIDFIFALNEDNKNFFVKKLGANANLIESAKTICKKDLLLFAKEGIELKRKEIENSKNETNHIEETMFFYPLIGVLNNLSRELHKIV